MDYTKNHHLPQWEETDRIFMSDFNQMCLDMESGLDRGNAAAEQAQATADRAVTAAARAQNTADRAYSPSQLPWVIGTYTGTGADQTITLGFRPKFLIIAGNVSTNTYQHSTAAGENLSLAYLHFNSTGFTVSQNDQAMGGHQNLPWLVETGVVYSYIAFR